MVYEEQRILMARVMARARRDRAEAVRALAVAAGRALRARWRKLVDWWQASRSEEQYLGAATDLADLERRIRVLERSRGGPAFVTFNH
jgi:hypothetical protein